MVDEQYESYLCHCMVYEFQQGKTISEVYNQLSLVFGDKALTTKTIASLFDNLIKGEHRDKPRPEQPSKPLIDENTVKDLINQNPFLTKWEIAGMLKPRQKISLDRMQKLGFVWKYVRWIPRNLSDKSLNDRYSICTSLLARNNNTPFLKRIITGDEIWITYKQIVRKREYGEPGSSSSFISKSSLNKIKLCIWWDVQGLIWFEVLKPDEKLDSERYNKQLDKLKNVLVEKRRGMVQKKTFILLHDNAKPYAAFGTRGKRVPFSWEMLTYPPYSPDLIPSAYHLVPHLENYFEDRQFKNEEDFIKALTNYLNNKDESFYKVGIDKLPIRWQEVINNDGNYISH